MESHPHPCCLLLRFSWFNDMFSLLGFKCQRMRRWQISPVNMCQVLLCKIFANKNLWHAKKDLPLLAAVKGLFEACQKLFMMPQFCFVFPRVYIANPLNVVANRRAALVEGAQPIKKNPPTPQQCCCTISYWLCLDSSGFSLRKNYNNFPDVANFLCCRILQKKNTPSGL